MIFVTVGSQMPFDRLVRAADEWAKTHPEVRVFAQIGASQSVPAAMEWTRILSPADYHQRVLATNVIVGHAGMGTVITAAEYGKPLVVMPRRGDLHETRNDHQVATARWLATRPAIWVASDGEELGSAISAALAAGTGPAATSEADPRLLAAIADFVRR